MRKQNIIKITRICLVIFTTFGDAASAVLLSQCEDEYGVMKYRLNSDGKGADSLIAYNTGVSVDASKQNFLSMNGRKIYKFSTTEVPESIVALLNESNLKVEDIKYFILHQANKFMLEEIRNKIGIKEEQFVIDMEDYGNTVSSTIPIAYKNLVNRNKIKKGDLIIFCGFGVGLSWGTVLYKYY